MLDRVRSSEPANPGLGFLVFLVVLACRDLAKTTWLQLHMADWTTLLQTTDTLSVRNSKYWP